MASTTGAFARLLPRVRAGDRAALARAITLLESGDPEARRQTASLGWPAESRVVALTGPPGVGKSALANALAAVFAETRPGRVGIVAVDPTSPRTGGALLGDRVRFAPGGGVFLRSMAARTGAAGLAPEAAGVLRLMAAAGMTRLLLETAGVGQGDHEVTRLADRTLALTAPGLGDAVQAAKAGLFEIADFVVVNQCDRPGAEAMASDFRALRGAVADTVRLTSATRGDGVRELAEAVEEALAARPPTRPHDSPTRPTSMPGELVEETLAARPPTARPGERASSGTGAPRSSGADGRDGGDGAGEKPPFPALRLHHVGIAVRDGDGAAAIWRALLGLRETGRYRVDEFGVVAAFLAPAADAGAEDPAGLLELVQPLTEGGAVARFLDRRGPGLHHVCFEVADLAAALRALGERGVRLVDEKPRRGAGGHRVAFVHPASAGGVLLELKQAEPPGALDAASPRTGGPDDSAAGADPAAGSAAEGGA